MKFMSFESLARNNRTISTELKLKKKRSPEFTSELVHYKMPMAASLQHNNM
jgi:hypothetical protein